SAVERPVHFSRADTRSALQPLEHRIPRPTLALEHYLETVAQHARNVVRQATAGDMRKPVHRNSANQLQQRLHVDARGCQQAVKQWFAFELSRCARLRYADQLADERIAVGMRAGGGEAHDRIARSDPRPVDNRAFLNDTDAKPGKVIIIAGINSRHFGSLT